MQRVLVIVNGGAAEAFYDTNNVDVAIVDFDLLNLGETTEVQDSLPDNWEEWAADFPVAYADINDRIRKAAGCPECGRAFGPHYAGPCEH